MIGEVLLHTDYEDTEEFRYTLDTKILEFVLMYFRQKYKDGEIEVETELIKKNHKKAKVIINKIKIIRKQNGRPKRKPSSRASRSSRRAS